MMLGSPCMRLPVMVSPRDMRGARPPPPPMAQAENAAVESALTLMITSGLAGEARSSCVVTSVGTPSGDMGSAKAQEIRVWQHVS